MLARQKVSDISSVIGIAESKVKYFDRVGEIFTEVKCV